MADDSGLLVLLALVGVTLWQLRKYSAVGFLGAWIFGILAPVPASCAGHAVAAEKRMYLSRRASWCWRCWAATRPGMADAAAGRARPGAAGVRQHDVRGGLALALAWPRSNAIRSIRTKRPSGSLRDPPGANYRVQNNLGNAYLNAGKNEQAAGVLRVGLQLKPHYATAYYNRAAGVPNLEAPGGGDRGFRTRSARRIPSPRRITAGEDVA